MEGVEIPVEVKNFITPDWYHVFKFYPEWKKQSGSSWPVQSYFTQYVKLLAETGHRSRTEQEWVNRIFEHFGFAWLEKMIHEVTDV